MQNENDKNNDPFRKNKSTVYGTPKNQRRNTKGTNLWLLNVNFFNLLNMKPRRQVTFNNP